MMGGVKLKPMIGFMRTSWSQAETEGSEELVLSFPLGDGVSGPKDDGRDASENVGDGVGGGE